MRVCLVCCIFLSLVGCQDTTTQQVELQTTLTEMGKKNRQLETRLADTTKQLQENTEKFASLEGQWKTFEAAFLPEQRQIFEQNSKDAHQLLIDLKATKAELVQECSKSREEVAAAAEATKEACDEALALLRTIVNDTSKLKEECVQHAKEANDVNLVGALKESVSELDESVKTLLAVDAKMKTAESNLRRIETDVRSAKHKIMMIENDVRSLKLKRF